MIAFRNILVATDFSEAAEVALRYGVELAKRFDAPLHFLHVVADPAARPAPLPAVAADTDALRKALEDDARASLATLLPEPDRSGVRGRLHVAVSSSPAHGILAYARDEDIDLIIMGTHGRHGLAHFFLGSVAQHVSRAAECPVLTVRAHARELIVADALPTTARPTPRA